MEPDKAQRIRWRRRFSKRAGRRLTDAVASFVVGQSLVGDAPVYAAGEFPFLAPIEEAWLQIRAELDRLMPHREQLPAFHQISRDQTRISTGDHWKVFILYGFGMAIERNCAVCPETARVLRQVPGLQSAWFSILAPRYHIPPHRGVTKTILRAHLGLITPERREHCRMRVRDQIVTWQPGKIVVFDDFNYHEVWNDTDEERVVLIVDFNRPMKPLGRMLNAAFIWGLKRTAFFKEPLRNLKNWDERLERAVVAADQMFDDHTPASAAASDRGSAERADR